MLLAWSQSTLLHAVDSCYPGSVDAGNNSISECIELDWSSAVIYWPCEWKAEQKKVLSWS